MICVYNLKQISFHLVVVNKRYLRPVLHFRKQTVEWICDKDMRFCLTIARKVYTHYNYPTVIKIFVCYEGIVFPVLITYCGQCWVFLSKMLFMVSWEYNDRSQCKPENYSCTVAGIRNSPLLFVSSTI